MFEYINLIQRSSKKQYIAADSTAKLSQSEPPLEYTGLPAAWKMQQNDAITGTEKQNVAEDCALRLNEGTFLP